MDRKSEKILVAGDVNGHFDEFFKKVNKIVSNHKNFSFLVVAGSFFGDDSEAEWLPYKNGTKSVPLDTYILGPKDVSELKYYPDFKSSSHKLKMAENVFCLGKYGVFSTSSELTLAYLSGFESRDSSLCGYSEIDTLKLVAMIEENRRFKPVDIFVTPQWPKDITTDIKPKNPSKLLQRVIKTIVPRYIFCASENTWYKRAPYNNDEPYVKILTRFIALGKVQSKDKWIYALELSKDIPELNKPLHTIVPSPYKHLSVLSTDDSEQFRWDLRKRPSDTKLKNVQIKKKKQEESDCWFCLSSPNVEKHLIISIGKEIYLARAKGGLVSEHLIISTVTHMKNYNTLGDNAKEEIDDYKKAIKNYYKKINASPVFFERSLNTTLHLQIDAVPIPNSKISSLKRTFETFIDKYELYAKWYSDKSKFSGFNDEDSNQMQYFHAELPTSEVLFIEIPGRFPILFARYVLADSNILNKPDRIDWRKCCESKEEETNISSKIRDQFKKYDPAD